MGVYTKRFKLRYDDIGTSNQLNIKSLIRYLQEMAGAHSSLAGYGLNDIPKTHVSWLLLDWKVTMFLHPHYDEEITIHTWPRTLEKFYSYRDFEVFDSKNNLVAIASSKWLLINTQNKKIERITPKIIDAFGIEDKKVFDEAINEKPSIPDKLDLNFNYTIQRRDIDTNGHVNNLHYIDYALETLPEEIYENNEFNNIEIHYKREIKYKDKINCYYTFENKKHVIVIKSENNSILHAVIKLY